MTKTVIFVDYATKFYIDYFHQKNYNIGLFKNTQGKPIEPDIKDKLDFIIPINFTSSKEVAKSLQNFYFHPKTIVVCQKDKYLFITAKIIETLQLDQARLLPLDFAKNVNDKSFQRKAFAKNYPEITPKSKKITTFHGAYIFARKYGFPVVSKPTDLAGSQLVNFSYNFEDLIAKISYSFEHLAEVYKNNQVYRKPKMIIEEYVQGQQYSVDSYVSIDGQIVHTPPCKQAISNTQESFETVASFYPADLDPVEEKIIYDTLDKAIRALNIKGSPTHIELRLDRQTKECKIIEANLRTGGERDFMLEHSYGINHVENVLNTYLGLPVKSASKLLNYSGCPQFWSEKEGYLQEVQGLEEARKLESVKYIVVQSKIGDIVGPAKLGYSKIVLATLVNPSREGLMQDVERIRDIIKFKVKPLDHDPEEVQI
jgi:cysteine synthase A